MDSWAANPCSRKTSPPMGKQKVYCASTAQVCVLHDAMPEHLRAADVDFIRGVVHPVQQWPNKPPKTDGSAAPIPISQDLALLLSASAQRWPGEFLVASDRGRGVGPWLIERAPYARPRSTSPRLSVTSPRMTRC
jgi:hypothetical protein